jgi:hypothetical protein
MENHYDDVINRIDELMKKKGGSKISTTDTIPKLNDIANIDSVKPESAEKLSDMLTENISSVDDKTEASTGTVFLMWFDYELYEGLKNLDVPAFPTRSAVHVVLYYDYTTKEQKADILTKCANFIEKFEAESVLNQKGRYFIVIGKKVNVKIQKSVIVEE